ncbi:MAG: hypothetical protein Q8L47_05020 [bacterium]|nr:hypothetical protein [bacterium]
MKNIIRQAYGKQGFANILLIVLVVALAGALGYVTWVRKPATEIVSTPTPTSSPNLQGVSGDETANWKMYSAAGIQFKYPNEWQLETKKVGVRTEVTFITPKKGIDGLSTEIFKFSYAPNQGGLTLKEWWAEVSKTDIYKKDSEKILAGVTAYVLQIPSTGAPIRYVFITKSPSLIIDIAAVGESIERVLATLRVNEGAGAQLTKEQVLNGFDQCGIQFKNGQISWNMDEYQKWELARYKEGKETCSPNASLSEKNNEFIFSDLDGDGINEVLVPARVVAASSGGVLYVFKNVNSVAKVINTISFGKNNGLVVSVNKDIVVVQIDGAMGYTPKKETYKFVSGKLIKQ